MSLRHCHWCGKSEREVKGGFRKSPHSRSEGICAECCVRSLRAIVETIPARPRLPPRAANDLAARPVPPGGDWTFRDHRSMADVIAEEGAS